MWGALVWWTTPLSTDLLEVAGSGINKKRGIGLNIFDSGIEYTEEDWVRLKVVQYPLQQKVFKLVYINSHLTLYCRIYNSKWLTSIKEARIA